MDEMLKFKRLIEEIARGVVDNNVYAKKVHAKLESISPLSFRLNDKISLYGDFLITPKYRVFREDEIGNEFVFQEDDKGQQYIYLYEAAPRGENGIEYKWKGRIDEANLIGKCPHGEVVVTHGTIEVGVHERGNQ